MSEQKPQLRVFDPDVQDECTGTSLANVDLPIAAITSVAGTEVTDLQLVLSAWHQATERLQKTHEVLCGEVRRLTHELEAKNRELTRKNRLADLGQMASHVAHE